MEKYHVFQTYGLMKVFIDLRGGLIKSVGNGSEGECFLSTNRDVYKIYFNGFLNRGIKPENVITKYELDLPSFLFPKELFIVDGIVMGHVTDYFPGNQFGFDNDSLEVYQLDYEALANAYDVFLQDLQVLSEHGIFVYELIYNLMFDGEKLVACDTCEYKRYSDFDFEELYQKNVETLDIAIDQALFMKRINGEIEYELGDFKKYYNQRQNRK